MTNLALQWPQYQGVDMEPDRIGNLATVIADLPDTPSRVAKLEKIQRIHGRRAAYKIKTRAVEILKQRQRTRNSYPPPSGQSGTR